MGLGPALASLLYIFFKFDPPREKGKEIERERDRKRQTEGDAYVSLKL